MNSPWMPRPARNVYAARVPPGLSCMSQRHGTASDLQMPADVFYRFTEQVNDIADFIWRLLTN